MVIQHNMQSELTAMSYGSVSKKLGKKTERLSSGYKINRAADDAAGLTISETMRRQIRGLTQASSNAQDGVSLIQTAEGAMGEIHDMLARMKELSVKSSNDTNTQADRDAIQADETFGELVTKYTGKASYTDFISGLKADAQAANDAGTFSTDFLQNKCAINLTDGLCDCLNGTDTTPGNTISNSGSEQIPSDETTSVSIHGVSVTVNWGKGFNHGVTLQIGSEKGHEMELSLDAVNTDSIGVSYTTVATKENAKQAMGDVEAAIDKVSKIRSKLGAYQNRLEHTIKNLDNVVENTTDAESRVRDADMADEMVAYLKYQILQQAGQAMIAQANQQPQGVLNLLGS